MAGLLDNLPPATGAKGAASAADAARPQGIEMLAAAEFHRRRALARRKVGQRTLGRDQANALVLPWLALACRAGADLPELAEPLAELRAIGGDSPFHSEASARACVANEIAPLPAVLKALSAAFTAAMARAGQSAEHAARYHALAQLAVHFRAVPSFAPAAQIGLAA